MSLHRAVRELEDMVNDREKYREELYNFLSKSWRWAREPKYQTVFRIQASILRAAREFLDSRGFVEVLSPIIGPVSDPGIRGAKQAVVDYYGYEYKVMSSAILYKQYMAASLGNIYMVSPNIRLEPIDSIYTGRHLVEFYQLDVEMFGADLWKAIKLSEELVSYIVKYVTDIHGADLEKLGRTLHEYKPPFPRYSYMEAHKMSMEMGCRFKYGVEIPWECEKMLSAAHETPFIIYEYPRGSRGFYDMEDPQRPNILLDFDMLYPEGFGEAISGAQREFEPAKLVERIREGGEDPAKYRWFLEMARELYPLTTSGFGLGIERITRFICGLRAVWEARPYPKVAGIAPTP